MLTTTSHDSVFLRADNSLIDMNYITGFTGMTDKWFYKLISEGHFPKPIKLGRSSRWYKSEVEQWKWSRAVDVATNRGILGGSSMKRVVMPVRWQCAKCQRWYCGTRPCPWCWRYSRSSSCWYLPFSSGLLSLPDWFVIPFLLIRTGITPVPACFPACLRRFSKLEKKHLSAPVI